MRYNILMKSLILIITLSLSLTAKTYNLYNDCEEYYDSRGFYHKDCNKEALNKRELSKDLDKIYNFLEPGSGENNQTGTAKVAPPKNVIDEEDLPPITNHSNDNENKVKALKERPRLEYGRE